MLSLGKGESGISEHKKGNTIPVKFDLYDKNNVEVTGVNLLSVYHITQMDVKVAKVPNYSATSPPPNDIDYFKPDTSTQPGSADHFTWDGSKWAFQMGTKSKLLVGETYAARIYFLFDNGSVLVIDNNGDGISFLFKIVK